MIRHPQTPLAVAMTVAMLGSATPSTASPTMGDPEPDVRIDDRDPFFERHSALKVGAKGEDVIDVSSTGGCVFHHAELVWLERRFADAQFVQIPQRGCWECEPLIVRWYHEPTGKAHFQVRVYRAACHERGTRKNAPAS